MRFKKKSRGVEKGNRRKQAIRRWKQESSSRLLNTPVRLVGSIERVKKRRLRKILGKTHAELDLRNNLK